MAIDVSEGVAVVQAATTEDDELDAIQLVLAAVEDLDEASVRRVFMYVAERRFGGTGVDRRMPF